MIYKIHTTHTCGEGVEKAIFRTSSKYYVIELL